MDDGDEVADFSDFSSDVDTSPTDRVRGMGLLRGQIKGSKRDLGSSEGGDNALDYDSQLDAINDLCALHRKARTARREGLEALQRRSEREGGLNDWLVGEFSSEVVGSIYQDAAHSMASVAMLAPLVESIFRRAFHELEQWHHVLKMAPPGHARWDTPLPKKRRGLDSPWDCEWVCKKGAWERGIGRGIVQLVDATDLRSHVSADIVPIIPVLFKYRNLMFHHGLEWPRDTLKDFEKTLNEQGCPVQWFASGKLGSLRPEPGQPDSPDIFFLTDEFVTQCLSTVEGVIEGLGKYARTRFH